MSDPAQPEAPVVDKQVPNQPTGARRDPQLSARDKLLEEMDAKVTAEREAEYKRFLTSNTDPRARAMAAAMEAEAKGEALDVDRGHRDLTKMGGEEEAEPTQVVDGAASVQPMTPRPTTVPAQRVSQKGEDPLGDYIVRVEGKPMFKMLVNGKEELVALDRARAVLQKKEAYDQRLVQVTEQQRQLAAREAALAQREAARARPTTPAVPAVDDTKLARELVRSLVTETEDKAAVKMAETFKAIRGAVPRIDLEQIRREAAAQARQTVVDERVKDSFQTGFAQFQKDYPDIAGDSDLFALADRKSEQIGKDNPTWNPGQVMLEAGRQTVAWLESIGAKPRTLETEPAATGNVRVDPKRQQRKDGLVPMPQPTSVRREPAKEDEAADDPASILAEMRKQRGQPS